MYLMLSQLSRVGMCFYHNSSAQHKNSITQTLKEVGTEKLLIIKRKPRTAFLRLISAIPPALMLIAAFNYFYMKPFSGEFWDEMFGCPEDQFPVLLLLLWNVIRQRNVAMNGWRSSVDKCVHKSQNHTFWCVGRKFVLIHLAELKFSNKERFCAIKLALIKSTTHDEWQPSSPNTFLSFSIFQFSIGFPSTLPHQHI